MLFNCSWDRWLSGPCYVIQPEYAFSVRWFHPVVDFLKQLFTSSLEAFVMLNPIRIKCCTFCDLQFIQINFSVDKASDPPEWKLAICTCACKRRTWGRTDSFCHRIHIRVALAHSHILTFLWMRYRYFTWSSVECMAIPGQGNLEKIACDCPWGTGYFLRNMWLSLGSWIPRDKGWKTWILEQNHGHLQTP